MKKTMIFEKASATLVVAVFLAFAPFAAAKNFRFIAIGDTPYFSYDQLDQLAARINKESVAFTVHVGDIKSGSTLCTDEVFQHVYRQFMSFEKPLVYTPGDNEWTDCHRKNNGSYDPIERLQKIRSVFFSSNQSLGRLAIPLEQQSSQQAFRDFPENRYWSQENISFATIHMVGSNNNLQPELPSFSEFKLRNEANIAWMRETFIRARAQGHTAIVLAMQADTFYDTSKPTESGFVDWLVAFQQEVANWKKPVLLIQGDSHVFKVDRPLKAKGAGLDLVQRLVVPGAQVTDAVVVDVNTDNPATLFNIRLLMH